MEKDKGGSMKTLLLLGGSAQQIIAIETAKRMGLRTVLCDYLPDNPGQYHADDFHLVSTTDKEAVLKVAINEKADGILAYASDPAAPTAAYVAEKLGLPGSPYKSVELLCNKDEFREFLATNHFHTPLASGYDSIQKALHEIQSGRFNCPVIVKPVDSSGSKGVSRIDDIQEAEDRDWNEQWEQEGFDPIVISNNLIIHDGRHLPDSTPDIAIEIDAKLSFGTGTHETTRMICSTLLDLKPEGRVLDCGTGTGILSICALKMGAKEAIGYDIDEWSVDNARHNAVINQVDDRFISLLGDASILNKVEGTFDLVMANINRNILLNDLPQFVSKMNAGATLILSGFYTDDCQILIEKAQTLGLSLQQQKEDQQWACLVFGR